MTSTRDPDRIIRAFVREGAEELDDLVYDEVRSVIDRTRQRAVIGPWRTPAVNKLVPIGLGAAAVVGFLLIGSQLLGPTSGGIGGDPSGSPSPTASPAPSDAAVPTATHDGSGDSFALTTEGSLDGMPSVPITLTLQAPGWGGEPGGGVILKDHNVQAPDGAGMIVFLGGLSVYGDPCRWDTTRPDAPATTVDQIVTALGAQASRDASEPVDIMLDGHPGKAITLHVPDDADFDDCDRGYFGSWGVPGLDSTPSRYHQDPGQIDEVWVVDVDGVPVTIDQAHYAGTPQSVVEELRATVESIRFE